MRELLLEPDLFYQEPKIIISGRQILNYQRFQTLPA